MENNRESVFLKDIDNRESINGSLYIENYNLNNSCLNEYNEMPGINNNNIVNDNVKFKYKDEIITIFAYSGFLILFFNIFSNFRELMIIMSMFISLFTLIFSNNNIIIINAKDLRDFLLLIFLFNLSYLFLFFFNNKENLLEKIMIISLEMILIIIFKLMTDKTNKYDFCNYLIPLLFLIILLFFIIHFFGFDYNFINCMLFLLFKMLYSIKKNNLIRKYNYNNSTYLYYLFGLNFILLNILIFIIGLIKWELYDFYISCYISLFSFKLLFFILFSLFYINYIKFSCKIYEKNIKNIFLLQPFIPTLSLIIGIIFNLIDYRVYIKYKWKILLIFLIQWIGNWVTYIQQIQYNYFYIKIQNNNNINNRKESLLNYYE